MLETILTGIGLLGLLFLLYLWGVDMRRSITRGGAVNKLRRLWVESLFMLAVVGGTVWILGMPNLSGILEADDQALAGFSIAISGLISLSWFLYLRRLDHFEPEPFWPQLLVFAGACGTVFLAFPLTALMQSMGLNLYQDPVSDFLYCVVGIGLVEEVVKIIPFLILLRFSRHINEPFDYILYGSLCALGFAFVENTIYLYRYELFAVNGRALYASVSHMFDTSVVCYSMAIARFYRPRWRKKALPVGLAIAALAHGFYDYWLISPWVEALSDVTVLFYLFTVYAWAVMKNNLMNLSNFFTIQQRIRPSDYKYTTVAGLLFSFALAAVGIHLLSGQIQAGEFVRSSLIAGVFILVFITLTFSQIRLVSGYLAPFMPSGRLWASFRRALTAAKGDELGERIEVGAFGRNAFEENQKKLAQVFPLKGTLDRNLVVDGQHFWYLMKLEEPLSFPEFDPGFVAIRTHKSHKPLSGSSLVDVEVRLIDRVPAVKYAVLEREQTKRLPGVWSRTASQ